MCNKETTNEELTAFLYRAILCEYHSCFIIAGIELLPFEQKTTLQNLLNELYSNNIKGNEKKMKSCLVIAYIDKEADIVKNIFRLKGRRSIQNIQNNLENQNMGDIGKNVNIIKSNRAGVGKSMQIKIKIKKSKRNNKKKWKIIL